MAFLVLAARWLLGAILSRISLDAGWDPLLAATARSADSREGAEASSPLPLTLTDVDFTYPGADHPALSGVTLSFEQPEFTVIVGHNGSGKSTLLKTIAGVYKPSKGKVTVRGSIAPLIELGAGFDMDLTARENIYLNGTVLGFSPKYLDEKFDEIVEFSELQNFLDVPLKNYSSGMVARIGFGHCHHHQARYPHCGRGAVGGRFPVPAEVRKGGCRS